jgi:hypothetical protein
VFTNAPPSNACDAAGRFESNGNSVGSPDPVGTTTGALVRDNYNSYTYGPTAPQISHTFDTTTNSSGGLTNAVSFNGNGPGDPGYYRRPLPKIR